MSFNTTWTPQNPLGGRGTWSFTTGQFSGSMVSLPGGVFHFFTFMSP